MPFVQLKAVNRALAKIKSTIFPDDLLFFPTQNRPWKWDEFELILPYFHSSRCRAFTELFGQKYNHKVKLRQLLRGCRGSKGFLDIEVRLDRFGVREESTQYDVFLHSPVRLPSFLTEPGISPV